MTMMRPKDNGKEKPSKESRVIYTKPTATGKDGELTRYYVHEDFPCGGQVCYSVGDGNPREGLMFSTQQGTLTDKGINGFMIEHLIAAARDRLAGFQEGIMGCDENAHALQHLDEALLWLDHRSRKRIEQGVEGTHDPHDTE